MVAQKEVKIKVATEEDLKGVQAIENNINKLRQQKLRLDIETNTAKLQETESQIESTKAKLKTMKGEVDVDDKEVKQVEEELARLESDKINIQLDIEKSKLESTKHEIDALDDEQIQLDINNQTALQAVDQISQGFDRLKQGASEIGQQMGTMLEAAGKQETNFAFLQNAVGNADTAKQKMEEINSIVQQLPGDDTVLQGLLSSAVAKDATLTSDALKSMGSSAADYFSAMSYYGKSASEAQQDMTNYLLAGNTAELERSPILQGHIDKLKEANTVQERAQVLAEALNEEHWGGMSQQDTYNNKLETFNGMLERGRYNLGGMLQEGAKWGMDLVMQLDTATGGLVGMGIALAGFASPITDTIMGLGQMATGFSALKDASDLFGITEKLSSLKSTVIDAATSFKDLGIKVLEAGYNAVKSAALWAYQKLALVASTIAEYGLAAAQAVLNFVMSINPIVLVVLALVALAAALIWAYNNVDWFREMVNNLWLGIQQLASFIWDNLCGALQWLGQIFAGTGQIMQDTITNAVNWIIGALQNLWNYIITLGGLLPANVDITGNQIIDTILRVVMFLLTLPLQIQMIFLNIIAKTLGFGDNFVQNMIAGAVSAVSGFIGKIRELPGMIQAEFERIMSMVSDFITSLPQMVWDLGASIVDALKGALGIGSPGHMYYMMEGELKRIKGLPGDMEDEITGKISNLGAGIVHSFNTNLDGVNGVVNGSLGGQVNNFYFTDTVVDNDERMEKIADYIAKKMSWDNTTAGRTV